MKPKSKSPQPQQQNSNYPSLNCSDLVESLPGALPSANNVERARFERKCLRLYDEAGATRCLAGRTLLLASSTFSVDLLRGFALLNESIAAWTRQRPGPDEVPPRWTGGRPAQWHWAPGLRC